ncbi:MAG TPA: ATP-binding protein [Gemmatimonadales bacterium]|nr:ATP-binding protein [Gemmatimonadales bacterium]
MTPSLRLSLAARFAATLAVALFAISAALSWAAARVLTHQLNQGISAAALIVAEEFARPGAEPLLGADPARYRHDVNRYVVLRDSTGRAVRAIPGSAMDLPADSTAMVVARAGGTGFADAVWHGMTMRTAYLAAEGGRVVQVAASTEPIDTLRRDLTIALIGIILLGSGATFLGAWRLAGSAVQPVHEITSQAKRIEVGTLNQRISSHATTVEYRGLVAVLNRMLDRLERAFQAQRRFTADVSHELRTPLTVMQGEIEVALRSERSVREYQQVLHSTLEEIDRLITMTEELLLITRVQAHAVEVHRQPTDVHGLIQHSLDRLRGLIIERELAVVAAADGAHVLADRELLGKLIDEMLENAVKYSEIGGEIRVSTQETADHLQLVIEDAGPGIAPEDLPHIFDPFYRADQARSRGSGTGLGLTTAAAIARLHGGDIRAANRPEGGARFEVELPTSIPA